MANTTTPQIAFSNTQIPTPTDAGTSSCQVTIPDYNVLRQQNITKINNYYDTLLTSYTTNYSDYATQSASGNINDRTYASTTIMPNVKNSNTQIINLSQAMINNVNQDTDLINDQKNQLSKKMLKIDSIMSNINLLSDKDAEMNVLTGAKQDSLNSTTSSAEDMQFTTYIYIGICILLVLVVIGLIIYLVSSNSTPKSSSNNSNNSNNSKNLYKNIATNNGK
jgi:hypothetical protein